MANENDAEVTEIADATPFTESELQGQAMKSGHMIGGANPLEAA